MGRKADISACKKAQITMLLEQRQTNRAIALACGVSTGTVQNIRNKLRTAKRYLQNGKIAVERKKQQVSRMTEYCSEIYADSL